MKYHGNFPARYGRQKRNLTFGTVGCLVPFFLIPSFLIVTANSYVLFVESYSFWAVALLVVGLVTFVFFAWQLIDGFRDARMARIVPYFQHQVGDTHAFASGAALARNCRQLDELAVKLGVLPLSDFGFFDDLAGEAVVWHEAKDGLATASSLLHAIRSDPSLNDDSAVLPDLGALEAALLQAVSKDVRFCLLLRQGNSVSGQELSVRQGSFT
jgi:hypothetical protein